MSSWIKHPDNPVFGGPEIGTCFDVDVHRTPAGFRMYFSWRPKQSIAFSDSPDGVNWSDPTIILPPNPDSGWEDKINRAVLLFHNNIWHMWYCGQARGFTRIGHATSQDGISFTRSPMPVMIPEFPWEKESVMNPFVLWDEETSCFRMWYAAGETYEPNALGYATSKDGITWEKSPINPIFVKGTKFCDKDRIGACHIIKLPQGGFLMFYIGYEDIDTARICMAFSNNGITNWIRSEENPIVDIGKTGEWDAAACYKPSVLWNQQQKQWMLWYNGRSEKREYIGLATRQGPDFSFLSK